MQKTIILILIIIILIGNSEQKENFESDTLSQCGSNSDFTNSFVLFTYMSCEYALYTVIDTEKLAEWNEKMENISSQKDEDIELYNNIYEFIKFFEIPRDTLEELYYSTNLYYEYDYNFDLLYGDDVEKVYEYYRDDSNHNNLIEKGFELSIKNNIKEYVGWEKFE